MNGVRYKIGRLRSSFGKLYFGNPAGKAIAIGKGKE
jgi:hypothetical protein